MEQNTFREVDQYLSGLFSLEDDILKSVEESIIEQGLPEHSVSANQGQFLFLLAKICKAERIIEIGSLGGYSTIWLARALGEKGTLSSIEIDTKCAELSRQNIKKAGLENKVKIINDAGLKALEQLEMQNEKVDLFFMDADKRNYINYFNWAIEHARPGTLILADNVIRNGKVLDENSTDEKVRGVQAYNKMIAENSGTTSSILQQVGIKEYDGLAISLVL